MPFVIGFIISLMGALPFGYINVIGLQLLIEQGNYAIFLFVLGIISVEMVVLKIVSIISQWLVRQIKLLFFIDMFTIMFFFAIGIYFLMNINNTKNFSLGEHSLVAFPFVLGLILNGINFIQWPYWSGIYIFLFRNEKLTERKLHQNLFILGALLGTFAGMYVFAYCGRYFLIDNEIDINKYLNGVFSVLFISLGFLQFGKILLKKKQVEN